MSQNPRPHGGDARRWSSPGQERTALSARRRGAGPARRKRSNWLVGSGISAGVLAALTGCFSFGEGSSRSINVGSEERSDITDFFETIAPAFTRSTGIEVNIVEVPGAAMKEEFASDANSSAADYDVFVFENTWTTRLVEKSALLPLDERLSAEDREDFLPHSFDGFRYAGETYGIPFNLVSQLLFYRPDLLEAAGIPGPPTTWAEYRAAAARLTDADAGVWGTIIPGENERDVAARVYSYIQQAGGLLIDSGGRPTLDTPEARAALEMMVAVQIEDGSSPPGLHGQSDIRSSFVGGRAAMVLQWPLLFLMATDPGSAVADDFAVALPPGNPHQASTSFGMAFGINSATDNEDPAWRWIEWATSQEVLEKFATEFTEPTPRASVARALAKADDLPEPTRNLHELFAESLAVSRPFPTGWEQYEEAFSLAISEVMSGQKDIAIALADAQSAADAVYDRTH